MLANVATCVPPLAVTAQQGLHIMACCSCSGVDIDAFLSVQKNMH
jgi:hypothetical protein